MCSNKYRIEATGSVFALSESGREYMFIGKLNGRTLAQFINELELCSTYEAWDEGTADNERD